MRRAPAPFLLAVTLAAFLQGVGPAAANGEPIRRCGDYDAGEVFIAEGLRADGVSCARARRVARQYLRYNDVRGWRCAQRRSGRVICRRRGQGVSFVPTAYGEPA